MTWLTPMLMGVAAAVALPTLVILYFLKLRRRDLEVSTTLLWKKSIQDLQANAPFQRIRRNILLLLQLMALAAVLLALGQPQWKTDRPPGGRSVILIDRSASMQATDESDASGQVVSRLARAKEGAIAYVEAMSTGGMLGLGDPDEAMVIAFDAGAEVIQPYTANKERLRAAIEAIEPTDAPTSMEEAMRLAGAYARPIQIENRGLVLVPGPPVAIWTDGGAVDAKALDLGPETQVMYHSVGRRDTPNVGIISLKAERAYDEPNRASVFVGLQSTSRDRTTVDVQLIVDGMITAVRAVELAPVQPPDASTTSGVVFDIERAEGAEVTVRLGTDDSLAADNAARLVLPPARRLAVALVSTGSLFLRSAVEGLPLSRLDVISPDKYTELARSNGLEDYDVFVFDRWVPHEFGATDATTGAASDAALPPGGSLIFGAIPNVRGLSRVAPDGEPAVMLDWLRDHPALSAITLENLVISRPLGLAATGDVKVLAQTSAGPGIVEIVEGASRAIVVGFDVSESNWPFDVGFVLFAASSLRYLGEQNSAINSETATPGGTMVSRLPLGVASAEIALPGGGHAIVQASPDGRIGFGPLRKAGLYRLTWDGAGGPGDLIVDGRAQRRIAVNLLDPVESRIDCLPTLDLASRSVAAGSAGRLTEQSLWKWLLLGSVAIMLLEWLVYNRKVHV